MPRCRHSARKKQVSPASPSHSGRSCRSPQLPPSQRPQRPTDRPGQCTAQFVNLFPSPLLVGEIPGIWHFFFHPVEQRHVRRTQKNRGSVRIDETRLQNRTIIPSRLNHIQRLNNGVRRLICNLHV